MARTRDLTGFRQTSVPADLLAPYTAVKHAETGPNIDRALQIYLPTIEPIPGASEFNILATKATVAVETNVDIGLTLDLPANNIGIIRGVNLFILDMLTTTVLTWTLTINGGPVSGYTNLQIFARTAPFVGNTFDSFVNIPQGSKVRVVYTNTDGGSYTIGAAISGWFWPQSLGEQWIRKGGLGI